VTIDLLTDAYSWLKREAAPGVDGRTWQSYKQNLEVNLAELYSRIHRGTYRALPSRRRYIPKSDGRQRPLGITALEDKMGLFAYPLKKVQFRITPPKQCRFRSGFQPIPERFRPHRQALAVYGIRSVPRDGKESSNK
jgi:retron-type reverse transcriptase